MFARVPVLGLVVGALLSFPAHAGGSWASVTVVSLDRVSEDRYVLVVAPDTPLTETEHLDPYMGKCELFQVRGTFSKSLSRLPTFVTRKSHDDALQYLDDARKWKTKVNVGWVGGGFHVKNFAKSCEVESRALMLYQEEGKPKAVLSYHDSV